MQLRERSARQRGLAVLRLSFHSLLFFKKRMEPKCAVIRCGGDQGVVTYDIIKEKYEHFIVFDDSETIHHLFERACHVRDEHQLLIKCAEMNIAYVDVFVCLGETHSREKLSNELKIIFTNANVKIGFPSAIHQTAFVSDTAIVGLGCFIGPFATIHTCARVGDFCIINSNGLVEHDCLLENYVNIAPAVCLCGKVFVEKHSNIGAGSVVREKCKVFC